MDEIMNNNEVDEAVADVDTSAMNNDELKSAIEGTLEKIRSQSIIIGYRVACKTIFDMIQPWHNAKASHNDFKRLFKQVEKFCAVALKQDDNTNAEETAQN